MKVTAQLNYLHISPRKVRALVNVVKKMTAAEALAQLRFIPNRSARPLQKLLKSALANAENNFSLAPEGLRISVFKVDGGPIFKRFRPGSRGRVAPIQKRTSHVTLVLEGERIMAQKDKIKKEAVEPVSRSMSVEEKEAGRSGDKKSKIDREKSVKQKSAGFVRRIFQRKAI